MNTLVLYIITSALWLSACYMFFQVIGQHDYRTHGGLTPFSMIFQAALFFIWGGMPYIYGPRYWPAVHLPHFLEIVGWVFLYGGLALMLLGIAQLGLMRALGQRSNQLIRRGFYRYSRNPQVVGCISYAIGFTLLWSSWYALGWLVMVVGVLHMMVVGEERHLRRVFGEDYVLYCRDVPRYLGRLRKP